MTTTAKKTTRRAKTAAKRALALEIKNPTARKAIKIGAVGAGAWLAGKAVFSAVRLVLGTALVVAAGVAAASLVPKSTQKQIAGKLTDAALRTRDTVVSQAKALTA